MTTLQTERTYSWGVHSPIEGLSAYENGLLDFLETTTVVGIGSAHDGQQALLTALGFDPDALCDLFERYLAAQSQIEADPGSSYWEHEGESTAASLLALIRSVPSYAEVLGQRDRARGIAVALEQENAAMADTVGEYLRTVSAVTT